VPPPPLETLGITKAFGGVRALSGVSFDVRSGERCPAARSIDAGRLIALEIRGREIILGTPLVINKGNIDTFDF
jgi:ABC-type branched-subunit amino acid transport system ATPase component